MICTNAFFRRALHKVVVALIALPFFILIFAFIAGLVSGDLRGHLAFGLLAGCIALTISAPIAMLPSLSMLVFLRRAWIAMTLIVLLVGLLFGGEAGDTVLTYAMVALSFPFSLLAAPLVGNLLGGLTKEAVGLFFLWIGLVFAGYMQWFVLLRHLLCKKSHE